MAGRKGSAPPGGPGTHTAAGPLKHLVDWAVRLLPTQEGLGLALRNLSRQPRRTALALAAVVFGVAAALLAGGFIEWNNWALRESTIQSRFGHIQVTRPGYFESGRSDPFSYLLPQGSGERRLIENMPHVETVAPRLNFNGLISHGDTTLSFMGQGVVPERERKVSRRLTVVQGADLAAGDISGVLIGKGLAESLGVGPGDKVVLLATASYGGMNAIEAEVRGIFQTSSKPFDDSALRIPIEAARRLLHVDGAHTWVILLDDTDQTNAVLQRLRARFSGAERGFQFTPWYDLADFYKKVVVLFSAQMNLVYLIIALIITVSIVNVLIMSVLERTPEIGTVLALGVKRANVLRLFVDEGLLLGIIGGCAGLALGYLLGTAISAIGIPMPPSPGMDFSFTGRIRITPHLAWRALLLAVSATVLGSLYPAWKASRLQIVDALRRAR
jgi:putative ABC transport system permease protein